MSAADSAAPESPRRRRRPPIAVLDRRRRRRSCSSSSGSITYSGKKETEEAQQKAAGAHAEVRAGGAAACRRTRTSSSGRWATTAGRSARTPRTRWAGRSCYDQLTNGAAFVGRRPVIVDRRIVLGEAADPGDLLPRRAARSSGTRSTTSSSTTRSSDSRWSAMPADDLRGAVAGLMGRARDDLAELVAFRSVADPKQYPPEECEKAAQWVVDAFAEVGLQDVAMSPTPGRQQGGARPRARPGGRADGAPVLPLRRAAAARRGRVDGPGLGADRARRPLVRARRGRLQGQHRHAPHRAARAQAGRRRLPVRRSS